MADVNIYADSNIYDIGDRVELTADFTDAAGADASPDSVVCKVRKPDGTELTPLVLAGDPGKFTATVDPDAAGVWRYRFAGTGGIKAASERVFEVREQLVP